MWSGWLHLLPENEEIKWNSHTKKEVHSMNKSAGLFLAVVCAVFLVSAVGIPNQVETAPGVITVSGEAIVKVVPDEVLITLGVETFHRELSVAKRRNEHSM